MKAFSLRLLGAAAMCAASVSAQAVVTFDSTNFGQAPQLLTSTSALGSLTVNANAYTPANNAAGALAGSRLGVGMYGQNPVSLWVNALNGGVLFTPSVSGSLASYNILPPPPNATDPYINAGAYIPVSTAWAQPDTTGLSVMVSGLASYLGQQPAVGTYGVSYTLSLQATSANGQRLTLLDIQSPAPIQQQAFSYTGVVPAGFDLASVNATLSASFSSSANAAAPNKYTNNLYKVQIDGIQLMPTIGAVPEPTSGFLWLLALPGLVVATRRRRIV